MAECGKVLLARNFTIAAVLSENAQIGRWAEAAGVACVAPGRDPEHELDSFEYDWLFSIANLRLLPPGVWRKARKGAVNFHDGPLPRYAGLNAPAWAILGGETEYGVTWHAITEGADDGAIHVQRRFEIATDDTALTLNARCFEAGIASFTKLLDMMEAGAPETHPQDFTLRSYFGKHMRPAGAATLNFTKPAADILRLCRALDFGRNYPNPLCLPKIWTQYGAFALTAAGAFEATASNPGQVISVDSSGAVIACADGAVRIAGLIDVMGEEVEAGAVLQRGEMLPAPNPGLLERIDALNAEIARHEGFFRKQLAGVRDIELYGIKPGEETDAQRWESRELALLGGLAGDRAVAAIAAALARLSGQDGFSAAFADDMLAREAKGLPGYIAPCVPLQVGMGETETVSEFTDAFCKRLAALRGKHGYSGDLVARTPGLSAPRMSVAFRLTDAPDDAEPIGGAALTFAVAEGGGVCRMVWDAERLPASEAEALCERIRIAAAAFAADPGTPAADLPVMTPEELNRLISSRNSTERAYDRSALVHTLFERQSAATPDAVALVCGAHSLSYAELDRQADAIARALRAEGAGPDELVGVYMERSADLVAGALGVLKAGAAYVPLDPAYPKDRVALMVEDSGARIILTQKALLPSVPGEGVRVIAVEDAAASVSGEAVAELDVRPDHLAYVIYTSGSTGRPKGVMVEHRNVVNFFAAMDDRITVPQNVQPVWLAVTSLSFDISVLELFWTLTRGFKVVILADGTRKAASKPQARAPRTDGGMDFSLFFWGHDDAASADKYRLLLEGARYADAHGFRAVWTPERHFHAFGGPYPNPAVTGAAVAAVTRNLEIRAGSCVLPLHHPARVAEEWAVIDNITGGRTALAFASGWMPEDFLLRPENAPPQNKAAMLRDIETVRRLWRGEKVAFDAPGGRQVEIVTQPRPVQSELPVWVTTAGNPETYRDAARLGANVLTHLLGQSIAELAEKIRIYREALAEAGRNPADFKVTLMLHTLIGSDREQVREAARQPMKDYLRSAAALIKQYAWAFPAFKKPQGATQPMDIDLGALDEDEMDAITEFAFLRYFDDSGLFGTQADAIARAQELKAIGVDEIACLIDFGVPHGEALKALEPLAEAVAAVNGGHDHLDVPAPDEDYGAAALIARHGVTHLQCTPSMAAMLLLDDGDRAALAQVRHLFIGGEALQGALLRELRKATGATIDNMYGPTETTIWSSMGPADEADTVVPLGTPLANTQLYVLDDRLRPVPQGLPGELFIGGDGVTRGYLNRKDLTDERFLPNPFGAGRIYRTGDLVRIGAKGEIRFIGRADHQVKVRGHRIELGEIEARLGLHPAVAEAVVAAREDRPGDVRIVAYIRFRDAPVSDAELADHVRAALPDFMVPAHFVAMRSFPLTPNAKVDRKALPRPGEKRPETRPIEFVVPAGELQQRIAAAFSRALGVEKVGASDNFFALGGHSLLAVQVHRDLKSNVAPRISITDLYRFPTVVGLAGHIQGGGEADSTLARVAGRAAMRRKAMTERRTFAPKGRETA